MCYEICSVFVQLKRILNSRFTITASCWLSVNFDAFNGIGKFSEKKMRRKREGEYMYRILLKNQISRVIMFYATRSSVPASLARRTGTFLRYTLLMRVDLAARNFNAPLSRAARTLAGWHLQRNTAAATPSAGCVRCMGRSIDRSMSSSRPFISLLALSRSCRLFARGWLQTDDKMRSGGGVDLR